MINQTASPLLLERPSPGRLAKPAARNAADVIARTERIAQEQEGHNKSKTADTHGRLQQMMPENDATLAPVESKTGQSDSATALAKSAEASTDAAPAVTEQDLVQVFKLLADETRVKILLFLQREGELHVSALCDRLGQSQPAVSHHLALLRDADLIRPRRAGKHNFYSVRREHFATVIGGLFHNIIDEPATPTPAS